MDGKKKELDTGIQFFQIESFAVNFIFIDTGEECDADFFEVYLPGGVNEAVGDAQNEIPAIDRGIVLIDA